MDRLLTPDYQEDSKQYEQFAEAAREAGAGTETFTDPLTFQLGGSDVSVYPPLRSSYEDDNDYSLAVMVQHGIDSFLFPGDAEQTRLDELMAQTSVNCTLFESAPPRPCRSEQRGVFPRRQPAVRSDHLRQQWAGQRGDVRPECGRRTGIPDQPWAGAVRQRWGEPNDRHAAREHRRSGLSCL